MKEVQVSHWNGHPTVYSIEPLLESVLRPESHPWLCPKISIVLMSRQAPVRIGANVSIHTSCNQNSTPPQVPCHPHCTIRQQLEAIAAFVQLIYVVMPGLLNLLPTTSIQLQKPFPSYSWIWINMSFSMGTANVLQPFTHHVHASDPLLRLHCASLWWLTLNFIRLQLWVHEISVKLLLWDVTKLLQHYYIRNCRRFFC